VQPFGAAGVLVSYTSERRLCRLLEGLVLGTAEHYGETLAVEEIQCMHQGDPGCVFTVTPPLP
jgi:predicted hydrocarbon binding protein